MIWMTMRRAAVTTVLISGALAGCGSLDVDDPTAVTQTELDNANGANLLRGAAIKEFADGLQRSAGDIRLFTDEAFADTPPIFATWGAVNVDEYMDRRSSVKLAENSGEGTITYGVLQHARTALTLAIPGLRSFVGPARVGEMMAMRGFTTLYLAEGWCGGFPLHTVVDMKPVYGGPLSTEEAFENALADFDSAVTLAADSARILNFARVGRARALLGLARYAEAATAATDVPDTYEFKTTYGTGAVWFPNRLGTGIAMDNYSSNVSVADSEGGNGLDFVSAGDPRVKTTNRRLSPADSVTPLYSVDKYPSQSTPIVVASGVEARLIEAEAALAAGDNATWLSKLNAPRQNAYTTITPAVSAPLSDLLQPSTDAERWTLMFRERAFWLYATGHRIGDLRRMMSQHGASADAIFPVGSYRLGDTYATGTNLPFDPKTEQPFSPNVTGCVSF